jgi:hydrogenase maturation protease
MILLIGYGNSFRRDDGAGPALARMIKEMDPRDDLRVITTHQLGPELAEEMAAPEVTAVIFMDAAESAHFDHMPHVCDALPRVLDYDPCSSCFGHHFSPAVVMTYAMFLYGMHPPAWLISIPGHDFGFGEGFSEKTEQVLSLALENAIALLRRLP